MPPVTFHDWLRVYTKSQQRATRKCKKLTGCPPPGPPPVSHHPSKTNEGQYAKCGRGSVAVYQFSAGEPCWHWRFSLFYPFSVRCLATQPRLLENIGPEYENLPACLVLGFQGSGAGCWRGSLGHFLGMRERVRHIGWSKKLFRFQGRTAPEVWHGRGH